MQKNTYNPLWRVAINLLHAAALNSPNPSQVVLNSVKPLRTDLRGFSSSSAKALITSIATSELICKQRRAGLGAEPYIWEKSYFVKSDRARNAFTGRTHCLQGRKSEFTLHLNTNFCLLAVSEVWLRCRGNFKVSVQWIDSKQIWTTNDRATPASHVGLHPTLQDANSCDNFLANVVTEVEAAAWFTRDQPLTDKDMYVWVQEK